MQQTDVLIVGSGIAALAVAYYICEELNVMIVTKGSVTDGNSSLAQGGIAAALSEKDSWMLHCEDTIQAGDGHTNPHAAKQLTEEGNKILLNLLRDGLPADRAENGALKLGMEGAHRLNRIVHAGGDETGKAMVRFLAQGVNGKVSMYEQTMVTELLVRENTCYGVRVLNADGNTEVIYASAVILAAGGCGTLYRHTSNHRNCTADGIALAYRAGAILTDMEFVQFHPTMLYTAGSVKGLVSEAVRGEGAFLQNSRGEKIMENVHPLADLAPRDVVSREIFRSIQQGESIFLNIKSIPQFKKRFPGISRMCEKNGIRLQDGLIPVMPGMHFFMGGIKTDLNGRTSVNRLYAAGEAACTGVHGANRLASNSLLEGLVFGKKIAEDVKTIEAQEDVPSFKKERPPAYTVTKQDVADMMERFAGIERNEEGLRQLIEWFQDAQQKSGQAEELSPGIFEMANMMTAGELIARAAWQRTESRGCHFRSDFPYKEAAWKRKELLWKTNKPALEVIV
ncbi:L-aspartate oxidase [Metabacillus sp. KIGAM252]|uniref:L-aspartate oxidase n=1 Tax=Metabacillus flavus TaxID=2823519 RepID=A0ABS5LHK1_9BACI|nr:L-aspartate oxidase [Metabacillus flavus]MBS2969859.1 L-aspartate oxidase [Metabacillus flavus]